MRYFLFIISCSLALAFCQSEQLFQIPKGFPKPDYNFKQNKLSKEKIALGRRLFYDPILSKDSTISCATCHSPYNAFAHTDHDLSHGIDGKIGTRNSPALMNLAWQKSFMWDGAINHLDMQALAPISHPAEMNEDIAHVIKKLQKTTYYPQAYYTAFGDSSISGEYTLKAIAQFMLTLVSADAKYDQVRLKKAKFTPQEQNGYQLFKKNCATCHQEPLFSTYQFANNGLPIDSTLNDWGRVKITQNPADSFKFKIPTLRNIEFSYPYMHDGRFKKLSQVINHYSNEIVHNTTLSPALKQPIRLSNNEKIDVIAFLLTLSDKNFIFNPNHTPPK